MKNRILLSLHLLLLLGRSLNIQRYYFLKKSYENEMEILMNHRKKMAFLLIFTRFMRYI